MIFLHMETSLLICVLALVDIYLPVAYGQAYTGLPWWENQGHIFQKQDDLLQREGIKCGTLQQQGRRKGTDDDPLNPLKPSEGDTQGPSGRVINGEETSNEEQPWQARVYVRQNFINNIPQRVFTSGGVIVSTKIILTCGHCLCNSLHYSGVGHAMCLPNEGAPGAGNVPWRPANQNRQSVNEIYYTIGTKVLNQAYDNNIQAAIYRYQPITDILDIPPQKYFSLYGDIGIVMDNGPGGLRLGEYGAIPICLPAPSIWQTATDDSTFHTSSNRAPVRKLRVEIAGRGIRSYPSPPNTQGLSSCYTNEGVQLNRDNFPNQRDIFLPCERTPATLPACYRLNTAIIRSFTPQATPVYPATAGGLISQVNRSPNDDCERLLPIAEATPIPFTPLSGYMGNAREPRTLLNTADRIEIRTNRNDNNPLVCYNTNKIGRYGICRTDPRYRQQRRAVTFGFCSRSCSVSQHGFEKMSANYFDEPPPGATDFMDGKQFKPGLDITRQTLLIYSLVLLALTHHNI